MKKIHQPGLFKRILCGSFAFLVTIFAWLFCVTGSLVWSLNDRELLLQAGTTNTEDQLAVVQGMITEMSAIYGFDDASIRALITQERILAYHEALVDEWWFGQINSQELLSLPTFPAEDIGEAIMADDGYRANVSRTELRTIAEEQIQNAVQQKVEESALPLRISLIEAALRKIQSDYGIAKLFTAFCLLPVGLAILCLFLFLLMRLIELGNGKYARALWGSALLGGAIVSGVTIIFVNTLDLIRNIAEISSLLPAMTAVFAHGMAIRLIIIACACALFGLVLMALPNKKR